MVVDSPPGAASPPSWCGRRDHLAAAGEPLMIVAQTNEQVDDLIDAARRRSTRHCAIGRLSASDYVPPRGSARHCNVTVGDAGRRPGRRAGHRSAPRPSGRPSPTAPWPWAIVDEAYQMRSDMLLRIAGRFDRALFVGDPGQLDPFSIVDDRALDRPVVGPDAERGGGAAAAQPRPAGAPAAGVLAAARLGGAGGVRGVLPVHRLHAPGTGRGERALEFTTAGVGAPPGREPGRRPPDRLGAARAAGPPHPAHRRARPSDAARRWR